MKQVTLIWNNEDLQLPDDLVGMLIRMFGHNSVEIIADKEDDVMLVKIMQSLTLKYGIGNILEYITFFFDGMSKAWTEEANVVIGQDYQTASEFIQKAIYAIPEAER
jgi:hypothetical protein